MMKSVEKFPAKMVNNRAEPDQKQGEEPYDAASSDDEEDKEKNKEEDEDGFVLGKEERKKKRREARERATRALTLSHRFRA